VKNVTSSRSLIERCKKVNRSRQLAVPDPEEDIIDLNKNWSKLAQQDANAGRAKITYPMHPAGTCVCCLGTINISLIGDYQYFLVIINTSLGGLHM
jgi:hypothetical protein